MTLTINGKEYVIRFGLKFLRELDRDFNLILESGAPFGLGLETKVPMLVSGCVLTLSEIIYRGTTTEKSRPKPEEIDDYIDALENVEELFTSVLDELKKHNATGKKAATLIAEAEKTDARLKAEMEEMS